MQSCPSTAKAGYCTILNFQSANPVHLFQRDFALETIFTITRNQHPAKSGVRVISFRIISDLRLFFPYPLQKNRCERLSSQRKRASPASGFESYRYLRSPQRKRTIKNPGNCLFKQFSGPHNEAEMKRFELLRRY